MSTLVPSEALLELTLPQLLLRRAEVASNRVALRQKDLGIWNELTWGEMAERVRYAALGLLSLGVAPNDNVAVLADNIPEWPIIELAAQSIGAVSIGVYASSVRDEVKYLLEYSEVVVVLAEDQEQVDKVVDIKDALPDLRKIIFEDPRGMRSYLQNELFLSWEGLLELGKTLDQKEPRLFEQHVAQGKPDDVCHLSATSRYHGATQGSYAFAPQLLVDGLRVTPGRPYR